MHALRIPGPSLGTDALYTFAYRILHHSPSNQQLSSESCLHITSHPFLSGRNLAWKLASPFLSALRVIYDEKLARTCAHGLSKTTHHVKLDVSIACPSLVLRAHRIASHGHGHDTASTYVLKPKATTLPNFDRAGTQWPHTRAPKNSDARTAKDHNASRLERRKEAKEAPD